MSAIPFGPASRGVVFVPTRPFRLFVATEARGALSLLGATVAALVWANSPWLASYEALWTTRLSVQVGEAELSKDLRHWVNDGLMTLFFLVVGLEISRQLKVGELRHWQMAAVPAAAALGGMAVPALLYLAFNAGGPAARGWAMAMAGDPAFALGVLALVGPRCPPQLRVFLLTLLLVGDIAAVAVVGLLYAEVVNILALAVVLELFAVVTLLRLGAGRMPARTGPPETAGRWALLPALDTDPTRRAHAAAERLLDRHGVVIRGAVMQRADPRRVRRRLQGALGVRGVRALPARLLRVRAGRRAVRHRRRHRPAAYVRARPIPLPSRSPWPRGHRPGQPLRRGASVARAPGRRGRRA